MKQPIYLLISLAAYFIAAICFNTDSVALHAMFILIGITAFIRSFL